jgi:hypothetical protein
LLAGLPGRRTADVVIRRPCAGRARGQREPK